MRLGLISDTHGFLDPRIPALFSGVQHIFHGGDVGSPAVLDELRAIAPLTAVEGNTDAGIAGLNLDLTSVTVLGQTRFLVHHIVTPERARESIGTRFHLSKPDIVVFGHSHKVFDRVIGGVRFLNPGYAGRPRFGEPRSVMILEQLPGGWQAQVLPIV